jgi:polyhydroxybutyrate depolymerase
MLIGEVVEAGAPLLAIGGVICQILENNVNIGSVTSGSDSGNLGVLNAAVTVDRSTTALTLNCAAHMGHLPAAGSATLITDPVNAQFGTFITTVTLAADGAPPAPLANVPGKYVHELIVDGIPREVVVYVPALAAGTTPVEVVFMFHGTTGNGEKFYNISGWKEKADAEGLIAVFPSALTYCFHDDDNNNGNFLDPGEQKVTTTWQNGALGVLGKKPLCTPAEVALLSPANQVLVNHPLVDDIVFVDAMLNLMTTSYVVDAARIYASGFSNGGSFTMRLVLERADRFAAIAAAAGSFAASPLVAAARAISVVTSIGNLDNAPLPFPLEESSIQDSHIKDRFVTPMLTMLQLADVYTFTAQTIAGKQVLRWSYTTSTAGAANVFHMILIEDLDHAYPNGIVDPLWLFFSGYALP